MPRRSRMPARSMSVRSNTVTEAGMSFRCSGRRRLVTTMSPFSVVGAGAVCAAAGAATSSIMPASDEGITVNGFMATSFFISGLSPPAVGMRAPLAADAVQSIPVMLEPGAGGVVGREEAFQRQLRQGDLARRTEHRRHREQRQYRAIGRARRGAAD